MYIISDERRNSAIQIDLGGDFAPVCDFLIFRFLFYFLAPGRPTILKKTTPFHLFSWAWKSVWWWKYEARVRILQRLWWTGWSACSKSHFLLRHVFLLPAFLLQPWSLFSLLVKITRRESFFEYPTGRFSNGRVIPDFIAMYLKYHLTE